MASTSNAPEVFQLDDDPSKNTTLAANINNTTTTNPITDTNTVTQPLSSNHKNLIRVFRVGTPQTNSSRTITLSFSNVPNNNGNSSSTPKSLVNRQRISNLVSNPMKEVFRQLARIDPKLGPIFRKEGIDYEAFMMLSIDILKHMGFNYGLITKILNLRDKLNSNPSKHENDTNLSNTSLNNLDSVSSSTSFPENTPKWNGFSPTVKSFQTPAHILTLNDNFPTISRQQQNNSFELDHIFQSLNSPLPSVKPNRNDDDGDYNDVVKDDYHDDDNDYDNNQLSNSTSNFASSNMMDHHYVQQDGLINNNVVSQDDLETLAKLSYNGPRFTTWCTQVEHEFNLANILSNKVDYEFNKRGEFLLEKLEKCPDFRFSKSELDEINRIICEFITKNFGLAPHSNVLTNIAQQIVKQFPQLGPEETWFKQTDSKHGFDHRIGKLHWRIHNLRKGNGRTKGKNGDKDNVEVYESEKQAIRAMASQMKTLPANAENESTILSLWNQTILLRNQLRKDRVSVDVMIEYFPHIISFNGKMINYEFTHLSDSSAGSPEDNYQHYKAKILTYYFKYMGEMKSPQLSDDFLQLLFTICRNVPNSGVGKTNFRNKNVFEKLIEWIPANADPREHFVDHEFHIPFLIVKAQIYCRGECVLALSPKHMIDLETFSIEEAFFILFKSFLVFNRPYVKIFYPIFNFMELYVYRDCVKPRVAARMYLIHFMNKIR